MGLDMYLYLTAKVEGVTREQYNTYYNIANWVSAEEILQSNIPETLKAYIHQPLETGGYQKRYTVFREVAYWRKFNALHAYFVDHFQDGVDNCQLSKPIDREGLQQVLKAVEADELPPRGGYVFGGTTKDLWYEETRRETIETLKWILRETDFDKEVLFYLAS